MWDSNQTAIFSQAGCSNVGEPTMGLKAVGSNNSQVDALEKKLDTFIEKTTEDLAKINARLDILEKDKKHAA